jgi:hypothetical protein
MTREFTEYNYSPRRKDNKVDRKTNAICTVYDYGKVYRSYAETIGILIGETLIATKKKWSVTTSKHQSFMHRDAEYAQTVYLDHEDFKDFVWCCNHNESPSLDKWKRTVAQALLSAR